MLHKRQCQMPMAVKAASLGIVVLFLLLKTGSCKPATSSSDPTKDKYSHIYKKAEKFNFDEVVQSKRLFGNYVNCFVEKGPCTESAKDGRVLLKDVTERWCVDICSPKLKGNIQVALRAFRDRHPEEWQIFLKKVDPSETKRPKLIRFIEGKE